MSPTRRPRDVLAELVPLDGRTVVDVGCGDGSLVRWLARRGAHAVGVEAAPEPLNRATASERVHDERYERGVAQELPLTDACADAVVYVHSLHHVPQNALDGALLEAARVLRPGGLLYVQEPLAEGSQFELLRLVDDETEVRALAQAALARAPAEVLRHERALRFDTAVPITSFDAFRDRIVLADAGRAVAFDRNEAVLRARFGHLAGEADTGQGFELRQPLRVDLLRRLPP